MTIEAAVRQVLSEMTVAGVPKQPNYPMTVARHSLICSLCANHVRDRVVELLEQGEHPE